MLNAKSLGSVVGLMLLANCGSGAELIVIPNGMTMPMSPTNKVSDNGKTVTGWHFAGTGWRWTKESGLTLLALLPGAPGLVSDIRPRGVSGNGDKILLPGGVWSEPSNFEYLSWGSTLMSSNGTVFGNNGPQGFSRWTEHEGGMSLGNPPGRTGASPLDASVDGSVVLLYDNQYLWSADRGYEIWGPPPIPNQPSPLRPTGLSGDGKTVVGAVGPGDRGAFRWTREEGVVLLPPLANGAIMEAAAASFDGSIIVGGSTLQGSSVTTSSAFIWDRVNGTRSLEAVVVSLGIDLQGRRIQSADDISPDGRYIVGTLAAPSENTWQTVAFWLDLGAPIPEPAGLALAAVALAAGRRLTGARRRSAARDADPRTRHQRDQRSRQRSRHAPRAVT